MMRIRSTAITMAVFIVLVIMLANALQPLLPWLIILIFLAGIFRLLMRS
jgi:hypothetical protein